MFVSSHCLTLGAVLVLVFVFSLALGLVLVSFAERTEELVLGNGGFGTVTVFAQQHLQGSKGRYEGDITELGRIIQTEGREEEK